MLRFRKAADDVAAGPLGYLVTTTSSRFKELVTHCCDRIAERDHFRWLLQKSDAEWDVAIDFIGFQRLILQDTVEALWRSDGAR